MRHTYKTDLKQYSGKWVAFVDNVVIETALSLPALMENLKHRRMKKQPSVMLVPRKNECPYNF